MPRFHRIGGPRGHDDLPERELGRDAPEINPGLPDFLRKAFHDNLARVVAANQPPPPAAANASLLTTMEEIDELFYSTWPELRKTRKDR